MKVCFIGNSHLSALKMGWDTMPHGSVDIDFFGAPRSRMGTLERRGDVLLSLDEDTNKRMAISSRGRTEIPLGDYDAFVICNDGGAKHLMVAFKRHRTPEMSRRIRISHVISESLAREVVAGYIQASVPMKLIRLIRECSTAPILNVPAPLPTKNILIDKPKSVWKDSAVMMPVLEAMFTEQITPIFSSLGVTHVGQPEETVRGGLSLLKYGEGSIMLGRGKPHDSTEAHHLNADFGRLQMEAILAALVASKVG